MPRVKIFMWVRIGSPTYKRKPASTVIQTAKYPFPLTPEALFPDTVDGRSLKSSSADSQLKEHKEWIIERLEAGWQPVTILEELAVNAGRSSFYRFLHRYNLVDIGENARRKIIPEIIHEPGEALIVDWGKLIDGFGARRKKTDIMGLCGSHGLFQIHDRALSMDQRCSYCPFII